MSPTAPLGSESRLPAAWRPWRRPSPLAGARPTPAQLAAAADGPARDDVPPLPGDAESAGLVRLLIVGITVCRQVFDRPGAVLGVQPVADESGAPWVPGWPDGVALWALPNPSGLNVHETAATLAQKWREVWAATGAPPASLRG